MRLALVFILFLATTSFAYKCQPVKVIYASKRSWVSGAPGGRSGVAYNIVLTVKQNISEIAGVWIGKETVDFTWDYHENSDTVTITYNRVNGESGGKVTGYPAPFDYKGEALIKYTVKGKEQYLTIKKFRKLDDLKGE